MRSRRPDPRPARTQRRILGAARELIRERGVEPTTLHDVASRAAVALGSIYTHFGSKEGLVAALLEDTIAEARESLNAKREHQTPLERVLAVGEAFVDLALDSPEAALALLADPSLDAGGAASRHLIEIVGQLEADLADAMAEAHLPAGDPRAVASLLTVYWAGIAAACSRRRGIALSEDAARWALTQAPTLGQLAEAAPPGALWQCPGRAAA